MIKFTYLKRNLAKATPLQRDIAGKHYKELSKRYETQVNGYRLQLSNRQISMTAYRKLTKEPFKALYCELRGVVKMLTGG